MNKKSVVRTKPLRLDREVVKILDVENLSNVAGGTSTKCLGDRSTRAAITCGCIDV